MYDATQSTIDLLNKAKKQFYKYDTKKTGQITSIQCIDALEHIFSSEITQTDISEIKSSLDEKVDRKRFGSIVIKLKQNQKKIPALNEEFILRNFSTSEIRLMQKSWIKFDQQQDGYLSFEDTRKCIEYTLTHYKDSKNNDSEIKKFFISKAAEGDERIYQTEYLNFISQFIKFRRLIYKKKGFSCFGF